MTHGSLLKDPWGGADGGGGIRGLGTPTAQPRPPPRASERVAAEKQWNFLMGTENEGRFEEHKPFCLTPRRPRRTVTAEPPFQTPNTVGCQYSNRPPPLFAGVCVVRQHRLVQAWGGRGAAVLPGLLGTMLLQGGGGVEPPPPCNPSLIGGNRPDIGGGGG